MALEAVKQYPENKREAQMQIGKAIAYGLDHTNGKRK